MKNKLIYLQYLRGIAAFMVLNFHCRYLVGEFGDVLFGNGSDGVIFFFCLSGFIISYTARKKNSAVKGFLVFIYNRFARVWPLYLIATLAMFFVLTVVLHNSVPLKKLVLSILFFSSGKFPVLHVGWSINIEMMYYFTWGFLFFLLSKKHLNFVCFLFALYLLSSKIFSFESDNYFLMSYHLYFFAGTLIGLNYRWIVYRINYFPKYILSVILSPFIVLYFYKYLTEFDDSIFPAFFCPLLILYLSHLPNPLKRNIFGKGLEKLGDVSYSVYLIHPIVIYLLPEALLFFGLDILKDNIFELFLVNIITIVISLFSYRFVERWTYFKLKNLVMIYSR